MQKMARLALSSDLWVPIVSLPDSPDSTPSATELALGASDRILESFSIPGCSAPSSCYPAHPSNLTLPACITVLQPPLLLTVSQISCSFLAQTCAVQDLPPPGLFLANPHWSFRDHHWETPLTPRPRSDPATWCCFLHNGGHNHNKLCDYMLDICLPC